MSILLNIILVQHIFAFRHPFPIPIPSTLVAGSKIIDCGEKIYRLAHRKGSRFCPLACVYPHSSDTHRLSPTVNKPYESSLSQHTITRVSTYHICAFVNSQSPPLAHSLLWIIARCHYYTSRYIYTATICIACITNTML